MMKLQNNNTFEKPLVSIIVASYNYENLIKRTLDSLLAQTYKNIEIIVVVDGSTDHSVEVIQSYVSKNKNVFLYTHENGVNKGLAETIKEGMRHCHGTWIAFCESDDYYLPQNIAQKIALLKKKPTLALIANSLELDGGTYWDKRYISWAERILEKPYDNIFKYFLFNTLIVTFSVVMVRKDILEKCNFESPVKPWLDFWLWRQIAFNHKIGFIPEATTVWFKHKDSYIEREKAQLLEKQRPSFIKASNNILRNKHPYSFWIKRYINYIFGKMENVDSVCYKFLGINLFSVTNRVISENKLKYKYKLFGIIPLVTVKKTFSCSCHWRFSDE